MRLLQEMGYRNVAHYGGGIVYWRREGLPLEEGRERTVRPEQRLAGGTETTPAGP